MDWLGIERRRLGTGMLVFGLVGLVIAAIVAAALIGGAFAARNVDDRLSADQARLAAALDRVSASMTSLAATTDHAADTLDTTSTTLAEAVVVLDSTSETARSLSDALNISILGSQPFAGASQRLQNLAGTIDTFKGRADQLATSVDVNATDVATLSGKIRALHTDLDELAVRVGELDQVGRLIDLIVGGIVLAGLLTAWVAAFAAFVAWAGWRLRRAPVVIVALG